MTTPSDSNFAGWIEAFQIFNKYESMGWPINAEHDEVYVSVNPSKVSKEDLETLDGLGWMPDGNEEHFRKFV